MRTNHLIRLTAAAAVATLAAGCSAGGSPDATDAGSETGDGDSTVLTLYTDQHIELIDALTEAYTEETGVEFQIQPDSNYGQVEAEGDASPADLFLSEDPGAVALLGEAELLEPIDQSTIDQVRDDLSSPDDLWVAYAARARVLYYNPEVIDEEDLPTGLAQINDPEFEGEFAYAPSGAFRATTQYLISSLGEGDTREFLEELKENGVDEQKNGNVRDTVEAGKHAMGLSNHYYWYRKAAEVGGPENMVSRVHHFPGEDPGNLILSSGAGILASSENKDAAADFLAWLTSEEGGQQLLMHGDITVSGAQYPVAKGTSSDLVGSLDEVQSPPYDMGIYADQTEAEELLKSLGMTN